ncbi:hypothetical protein QTP88_005089 [Uroleucon formosanum]
MIESVMLYQRVSTESRNNCDSSQIGYYKYNMDGEMSYGETCWTGECLTGKCLTGNGRRGSDQIPTYASVKCGNERK